MDNVHDFIKWARTEIMALKKRIAGLTALTGDGTAAGTGSQPFTLSNNAVTNAKLADMAEATFKMRAAGTGTGDPIDGTPDQASAVLDLATDPFLRTSDVVSLAATVGITIDGGGATITTGVKGYVEVPFAMTITAARMYADQSGSIVIDVWKDTYANFPPVDADSITASAPPTISTAQKSEDTTLTGWTTAVAAGDVIGFNVDSVTTIQRVTLQLRGVRT